MADFGLNQMQQIQRELQAKYADRWTPLEPTTGRQQLLWMIAEAGEVADVMKKRGDQAIVDDPAVRTHFVEELCDVLMYFNDVLLCYGITADEIREIYLAKHQHNMTRW